MKKKLLFIHLAKTGGASIRRMLNCSKPKIEYDCIHNGKLISFHNDKIIRTTIKDKISIKDYQYTAYFIRNPYSRLLSCYKYFYNGGLNQQNTNTHQGDKKTQQLIHKKFPEFKDCCYNLKEFCETVSHAQPMTNSIFNYCDLINNSDNIIQGRFETYNDSVINLFSQLDLFIQPKNILKINTSQRNNEFIYDPAMKNEVYEFYRDDFRTFNYEK